MRKPLFISLVLFSLIFISSSAWAHPPSEIIFNFEAKNRILAIGVAHAVKDSKTHFIKQIIIKLNDKDWINQNFLSQTNLDAQAVSYAMVQLKKGDTIKVLAICNKSGQLEKSFKIE